MNRAIVSVATSEYHQRGQARLKESAREFGCCSVIAFQELPPGSPPHPQVPYAFKPYALKAAQKMGAECVLWCDACIVAVRDLTPLWNRIEAGGHWMIRNGFSNYQWTADSAYPHLFSERSLIEARKLNREIPHVVAGCFGVNLKTAAGRYFLQRYQELADAGAFQGPWTNTRETPCGPPDVKGHRHDQTAASVLAWRLHWTLTDPPEVLIYGKPEAAKDRRTLLVADGSYK